MYSFKWAWAGARCRAVRWNLSDCILQKVQIFGRQGFASIDFHSALLGGRKDLHPVLLLSVAGYISSDHTYFGGRGCSSVGALAFTSSIQGWASYASRWPLTQLSRSAWAVSLWSCVSRELWMYVHHRARSQSGQGLAQPSAASLISERLVGNCLTPGPTPSSCSSPWRRKCGKDVPFPLSLLTEGELLS